MRNYDQHIPIIIATLRKHVRVMDALPELSAIIGWAVSGDNVKHALQKRGLPFASEYLKGGRMNATEETNATSANVNAPDEWPEPKATQAQTPKASRVHELVALLRRAGTMTIDEVANALDMSPAKVRALIDEASAAGFNMQAEGATVGAPPKAPQSRHDSAQQLVQPPGDWHMFGYATDLHFGSKHHLGAQLEDHIGYCYEQGARTMICTGDMLDGVYKHSRWEQSHHGFEEQVQSMIEGLPKRPGAHWHVLLGNHDETFEKETGLDVGRAIVSAFNSAGRFDITCHGARGAYVRLVTPGEHPRGVVVEMWHPIKGCGYALTYQLQNHIRDYAVGQKPDILLTGHWHKQVYFEQRGVHAFAGGCFQGGGSSFGKSLGGAPSVGGWLIRYRTTADGTIRDFVPQWRAYYEREAPRSVEMSRPPSQPKPSTSTDAPDSWSQPTQTPNVPPRVAVARVARNGGPPLLCGTGAPTGLSARRADSRTGRS